MKSHFWIFVVWLAVWETFLAFINAFFFPFKEHLLDLKSLKKEMPN